MSAYGGLAEVYDQLMADMPYDAWLQFTLRAWERYGRPKRVADLGCGTGTFSGLLAEQGVQVIGIDISPDMLAVASSKNVPGNPILYLQQDMREWDIGEPADGVICYCDGLNYLLEEDDLTRTFARTYEGLVPGGLFLFDMHTVHLLERYAENQPFVLDEPDLSYIWVSEYDRERCEIEHELTLFVRDREDGDLFRRVEEVHRQRAYDPDRITELLRAAGFAEVKVMADFTWDLPPSPGTERLFFVARK